MTRHLLDVDDLTPEEFQAVLELAGDEYPPRVLAGKGVALLFQKPSARTRNSSEMAVFQLGGHPVSIRDEEVGVDRRESAEDVARTLAQYHCAIGARVLDHGLLLRMAAVSGVPVINLLSDQAHPLQALADVLTLKAHWGGTLAGRRVAWVGDGNNVARSLALACALAGVEVAVASPEGYGLDEASIAAVARLGGKVSQTSSPAEAVKGAGAVFTDAWVSMGDEAEAAERARAFRPYQVGTELMALAAPGAVFLHCLPAHRGEEVTAEVIDGPSSLVWPEAANRLRAMRGLLLLLFGGV
ncbi:MAG: ornithine carbamoyltransferase [Actinomycetota bacterium]|jgi:ornithine carbamoyltransferase|nr:ornithine carbamoyltransferase [Actinomycetota bacterium]